MKNQEYKGEFDVFETPDDLWNKIETKLDRPARKKRIYLWSGAAAAVLVTALVIGNYPSKVYAPESKQLAVVEMTQDSMPTINSESGQKRYEVMRGARREKDNTSYKLSTTQGTVSYHAMDVGMGSANYSVSKFQESYEVDPRMLQNSVFQWDLEKKRKSTYTPSNENKFIKVKTEAQSTFSIDVDGASYSDVRGMIRRNELPHPDAVRLEEFINYFPYNYSEPKGDDPFGTHSEVVACPWNSEHRLMKIGIKGESIDNDNLPSNNLVFLLDVSGSMMSADKLELLKKGFGLLVQEMREQDRVSICVYAGAAGLVLPPTSGAHKDKIMDALNSLEAGGSTAGGEGIELAYATAQKHFNAKGNNRVILATDGDFNVGLTDDAALVKLIEKKRKSGVFLTVLGFGHDNFQSSTMEKLANNGNGNFAFIDNILEAKKVLVTEMGGTLKTIAKDVKIQLDFNPENVESYRLIGYENRLLKNEDFANDAIDAGELGAGHTVTAIYEIVPTQNAKISTASAGNNGLQSAFKNAPKNYFAATDWATLKFRYKAPTGTKSTLISTTISNYGFSPSSDMQFIEAVVEFGLILRNSKYKGTANYDRVLKNARLGLGLDPNGYRSEFIQIVEKAKQLTERSGD